MRHERTSYPTDLTDDQWKLIEPLFAHMRVYKWTKRELMNAVLYLVKTGCQWRQLPNDFPPWKTVYSFFRRASLSGLIDKLLYEVLGLVREKAGKPGYPTYAIIDSQSVKTTGPCVNRGYDGGKKN